MASLIRSFVGMGRREPIVADGGEVQAVENGQGGDVARRSKRAMLRGFVAAGAAGVSGAIGGAAGRVVEAAGAVKGGVSRLLPYNPQEALQRELAVPLSNEVKSFMADVERESRQFATLFFPEVQKEHLEEFVARTANKVLQVLAPYAEEGGEVELTRENRQAVENLLAGEFTRIFISDGTFVSKKALWLFSKNNFNLLKPAVTHALETATLVWSYFYPAAPHSGADIPASIEVEELVMKRIGERRLPEAEAIVKQLQKGDEWKRELGDKLHRVTLDHLFN